MLRQLIFAVISVLAAALSASADDRKVIVCKTVPAGPANAFYPGNRVPLEPSPLMKLPIGAIVPQGWLRHQLALEADGMEGRLPEISAWLKLNGNGWIDPKAHGGWEELPYWLKGFGDLGYVLQDPRIIRQARQWIDGILVTRQPDGWFGPQGLRTALAGKPDMWPHMPVLNAMQSYYEFTKDRRALDLMSGYFKWQNGLPAECFRAGFWPRMRFGDNLESVYWLYNRTGEAWLLELAKKIHENMADWTSGIPNWHNVNVAECFREPAEYWLQAKAPKFLAAAERNYQAVMGLYGQFPGGGFAGDENCRKGFYDPRQGFETCGIVEFMHSFEMLSRISGNPLWADRCEELAFNSLPAALTPDLKALHYLTGANMIQLDRRNKSPGLQNGGTMLSYSPGAVYRCCQHNHGMGWPYYAEELWLATAGNGLCAALYAECEVSAKVGDGTPVKIVEQTDYPFSDTVRLNLTVPKPVEFSLTLRIPRWCGSPVIKINGQAIDVKAEPLSYVVIRRAWADGDRLELQLPMQIAVRRWAKNHDAASVEYGPLAFSLKIGEKWTRYGGSDAWPEWEVFPTTPWNYGLVLDEKQPAASLEVVRQSGPLPRQPFTPDAAPIELKVKARRIPAWTQDHSGLLNVLQASPARSTESLETITLIPMGAARLRITVFPTIGSGPDAHDWVAPPAHASHTASHCFEGDSLDALSDGLIPRRSNDQAVPRFTWWPHRGTSEWVSYDLPKLQSVSTVEVYWFDDTGKGSCRVPKSWCIEYHDGRSWRPVGTADSCGVALDKFNVVHFALVTTRQVRLIVELQPNYSAGILEWHVK